MKNKYARHSGISEAKIRDIVRDFAVDLTALEAVALSGLNRNIVNRFYRGLRERMVLYGRFRVDQPRDEFTWGTAHINGIEGFWGLAKLRLAKFEGLPRHTFYWGTTCSSAPSHVGGFESFGSRCGAPPGHAARGQGPRASWGYSRPGRTS